MAFKVNLGGLGKAIPAPNLGTVGYVPPQQSPGVDLSFLNDPNNPYLQQQAVAQDYSGGGGGGGDYANLTAADYATQEAPAPVKLLEAQPEWIAYLNSLGLEKNQFAADIERQRGLARANAEFQTKSLEPQYAEKRRNLTAGNESRGMARSGKQLRDLSVSRANQTRQQAGIQQGLTNTLSGLESSLAQKNLELETQKRMQEAQMIGQGYQHVDFAGLANMGK